MRTAISRKDGTTITVEDNGYFFLDSVGEVTHMVGFIVDITARKQAEAEREQAFIALQKTETRFRRLVESNVIGIIVADFNGKITEANDAFLQMVGYTRSELLSGDLRWDEMTPPEYRSLDEGAIAELPKPFTSTELLKNLQPVLSTN